MDILSLTDIKLTKTSMGTRVDYQYSAPESLERYIKGSPLFVEFPNDMHDIPEEVLAIPFVGIMSTVTMLLDIEIHVPALEEGFLLSMNKIHEIYNKMYANSGLNVLVTADRTRKLTQQNTKDALFFTGGVDATSALIGLTQQKPVLLNVWGGDIRLTDHDSHEELEDYLRRITTFLGLEYAFVKTNGREMFREDELGYLTTKHVGKYNEYGWWATIAHTLSMGTTVIPWMVKNNMRVVYIGSTHASREDSFDANNEALLDAIDTCSCKIKIADGELVRNEKVTKIVKWKSETDAPIQLKVCWKRSAGKNCSSCEKCYRTILNIISNHGNPNDFGFTVNQETLFQIRKYLETHHVGEAFWLPIQQAFQAERTYWEKNTDISWFLDIKINSIRSLVARIARRVFKIG